MFWTSGNHISTRHISVALVYLLQNYGTLGSVRKLVRCRGKDTVSDTWSQAINATFPFNLLIRIILHVSFHQINLFCLYFITVGLERHFPSIWLNPTQGHLEVHF